MTSCNEDDVNNKETNFRSEQKGGIFHWYTLGSLAKLGWVGDNKTMSEHSWIHFYVSWKGLTTLLMDLSNKESLKQCFLHLYIKIICDIDSSKNVKAKHRCLLEYMTAQYYRISQYSCPAVISVTNKYANKHVFVVFLLHIGPHKICMCRIL